jgi:hypothetical protein
VVVTDVLPLAETKPAILTDRDGFLSYGIAFEARHMVVPYAIKLIARVQKRPPINNLLTRYPSIGLNGVLLRIRAQTHASESAGNYVKFGDGNVITRRHLQPKPR